MTRPDNSRRATRALLQREAKLINEEVGEGNLVKIKEAKFLSLVGLPANETGFKVVRSKDAKPEDKPTDQPTTGTPIVKPTVRRTRRSDASPVLALAFPEGTTEADVTKTLGEFGLAGYKVEHDEDE